mmetsp:Transcript_426/g.599  ORF Transcript_426/g.599 Transcript_426/m.599 type:complete len:523 (-) Transcript_426:188-1756(-)
MRGKANEISTYIEKVVSNELSGNVVDLCPVGALNNLPYSFQARPWELKSNYTIDAMDAMGANIDAHTRGSDLLRILPRINEEVNEEWISDKSRHAFDGLKKQRLTVPMSRKADGTYGELDWQEAMQAAAQKLSSVRGEEIQGVIGPFQDVESIVAFKDLLNRLNCDNLDVRSNQAGLNADFRSQYLMNSRIVGIDETDLLIFVGTNPKTENPVLNARIKKSVQVNGLDVAVIGPANNLSYEYTHLGNTLQTLQELADGTHPFCERLAQAELPMIVVGNETLAREDGQAIQNLINDLASKTNLINEAEGWNGVNILHTEASRVGALDLGVVPRTDVDANAKVVFLLGADNFRHEDIPEDAYVIYMGTSGDEGVYYADLILPTSSYLERNGTYVNMDGRVQQTRATITPPGFARDDWMVLRALSEELGIPLPYDSLDEVRTRLAELAPHLVRYDHIEPGSFDRVSLMDSGDRKLSKALLSDAVDNFYMTDPISRNSHIMARCTRELNPAKQTNFKEWVNTWYTH